MTLLALHPPILHSPTPKPEPLSTHLTPGRIVELSGSPLGQATARTTTAVALLRHAQTEGETTLWIQAQDGPLYPPDLQDAGVDLDALVVVHVPQVSLPHGPYRAGELLLRSGAFGLLVMDLVGLELPPGALAPWLGRMSGLARKHDARVLLLSEKSTSADSLGALVGLRIESQCRVVCDAQTSEFVVEHRVLKNKSGAPFVVAPDRVRGPEGVWP